MRNKPQRVTERSRPVLRFPQLLEAGKVLKLVKRLWPSLQIDFRATKHGAEFIFRLPPPPSNESNKSRDRDNFRTLFQAGQKDWKRNTKEVVKRLQFDGRPIMRRFKTMLYKLFLEAFRLYLEQNPQLFKGLPSQWLRDQLNDLQKHGPRKRGPKSSKVRRQARADQRNALAVRLAQTYEDLLPKAGKLRDSLLDMKKRGELDEAKARSAVEVALPSPWAEHILSDEAFKGENLVHRSKYIEGSITDPTWTAKDLTVSMMVCRERASGHHLSPRTLYEKYILPGKKLLGRSPATQPKP